MKKYIANTGYIAIWDSKIGHVLEHRYIMEQLLGRKLNKEEHVHHINGTKTDNRIENLVVLDIKDHGKYHSNKYYAVHRTVAEPKKCVMCGDMYPYKAKIGIKAFSKSKCCSIQCASKLARSYNKRESSEFKTK